ncbi:papilin-like isoform X2 [Montipora foliosa]|uniref:papilin-like isoform X2 n=1 Tax=Montipora foliosa TaxID=591990 RepID=UPI0035F13C27
MSLLRIVIIFLTCECLPAKFVETNQPFLKTQEQQQVDEKTSMAELKRLFESLDQMSASSQATDDSAVDRPVAWYEPEADEPLYDKEKEKCWESKYGCCPDHKTLADGPRQAGCGVKLCVDLKNCENIDKDECDSKNTSPFKRRWLRDNCAYTCGLCKAPSPTAECEFNQPVYGCCWNGQEATGWNEQGCLPCEDTYPTACRILAGCESPFYNMRTFVQLHCPKTCEKCGGCLDKKDTAKCEKWEREGLCRSPPIWKHYMEENCAKTCRFCESNENYGVRSLFGM